MLYAKADQAGQEALDQALKRAQKANWYRRLKAIDLSAQGHQVSQIAGLLDLSENTVRQYIHGYNEGGLEGLKPKPGPGRKQAISLSKEEIALILERSPSQFEKLESGARNWNQALMQKYLSHYHQIKVSQGTISNTFKRLGLAWNRAKKK